MAERQLAPFRTGTRQRRAKVGVVPFVTSDNTTPLELPRVGMASKLIVQLRGTITLSGAGALTDLGPWDIVKRIRINTNIGAATLVDCSGYGLHIAQKQIQRGWNPSKAGIGDSTPNADIHLASVAATGSVVLTWEIPLGANDGANFETGLINLQAPETRVTFETTCGTFTDAITTATAFTGNFHVYYEYYEIPNPAAFAQPPLALVRLLEDQQALGQTGENIYTVPRGGTVLNLAHVAIINGVRSDSIDSLAIKFNKTDSIYQIDRQWSRVIERQLYETLPITGVFYHDLFHAYGEVNKGDTRDAIDSEQLTTFESILNVSSGAVLGANNNFVRSVRRILQVLQ